jgi:hypothetical protein
MSFFEPDSKRRKLLNDISLTDNTLGQIHDDDDDEEGKEKLETLTYKDVLDTEYKQCYACEHLHSSSLEENENYRFMMRLYTENSSNVCKNAIYINIHKFYNDIIVPDLKEVRLKDDPPIMDWTVDSIREHFECHTNYPTDEIIFQIRMNKALRNKLANNIVERRHNGTMRFNIKNMDILMRLDKMIIELMKTKKDINSMVGYSKELDY